MCVMQQLCFTFTTGVFSICQSHVALLYCRLAGKSVDWFQRSVIDASMAAFSFTPNPMTARGSLHHS